MAKRSAIESVPGRDALLEYEEKAYPIKTYVERNGVIYKSISATSNTFVPTQWELVADFRDIRVPDIAARNSLTGNTGFVYGVHTPILDNSNVLVLDASADPEVGVAQFARYNYNAVSETWLILQIGTGATSATTSIEYANVLNRPPIVSGVTVNAGAGLTGGGAVIGNIPANGGVISIAHADTSSQASLTPTDRTYIQQLRVDSFGHVTGATQSTWTHPTGLTQNFTNTGRTYIQSIQVNNGHVQSVSSSPWTHPDTSSQANSVNAGQTFIQSLYVDGDGHVTNIVTGVAAGGGGGGSPLTYNGDSGGVLTMNSGSTLTISGGTNILTVRTGNAANPGLRINFNPAGLNGQIQYNNGGTALAGSPNLFFSAGTSTLRTNNFVIGALPISGATSDDFLVRNAATGGAIRRVGITAILSSLGAGNGLNKFGNNIRLGGALTGNTTISGSLYDLTFTTRSITLGTRSAGTVGSNSLSHGQSNLITLTNSFAGGDSNTVSGSTGGYGFAFGNSNIVRSNSPTVNVNFAIGRLCFVTGTSFNSGAIGAVVNVGAANTYGIGNYINASGGQSIVIGNGDAGTNKKLTVTATRGINISSNTNAQVNGHGVHAQYASIFGGINHNIESGNIRATIIGGNGIKLTGTTYIDYTSVGNLAIMTAPSLGIVSTDDVLVRRSTTGTIHRLTQASLVTANNGLTKIGANVRLGGALTGNTTVSGSFNITFNNGSYTFGTRTTGSVGSGSFTFGSNNVASGLNSLAMGVQARASGNTAIAMGSVVRATGLRATAIGWMTSGDVTKPVLAAGDGSFNLSNNSAGQTVGHGALASYSAIFGGQDHNIEASNTGAVILGGSGIKLTAGYQDFVAMRSLALFTTPLAGVGADDVLVWNSTDKKVKKVTQASISDERLKKNLEPLTGVLDKIEKLSTVEFQYNELNQPELHDRKDYGLIAQEVEEQYPFVVNDNLKIEGDERYYKTVEYRKLVPILFAAIKELRAEINQLKNNNCNNCKCHG